MPRKILVAGGAGYVGGAITDRLIEAGHEVRVYDALLYEESYLKPVDFTFGDVRDEDKLLPLLRWADVVVWLAALVGDGACALDPDLTRAVNIDSVAWLRAHFDGRIIFMSTCSVYGAMDGILTEESAMNPLSLYAESKLEAEKILADSDAISFRLGTLFGLGDTYSRIRMDLVVNTLTVKACLYRKISVFGGNQFRPLLHVRDVAEAVVANVETNHRGVFNLHKTNMKIVDIAEILEAQVPDLHTIRTEMKFQDARNYCVSSQKAEEAFGFKPKLSVEYGIAEMRRLVEEGRIRDISSARFSNNEFLRPMLVTPHNPLGYEVKTATRIRR